MKQSLRKGFENMSLEEADSEGEDFYWDEEEYEGCGDYGCDHARPANDAQAEATADVGADVGEVCAICLTAIEPENLAIVKGCEHEYCVNCILQWAVCKEAPWCPQCKKPFNYLYCHRLLDGTLSDAPVEESVCLLKRAAWFVEHMKTLENGKAVSAAMAAEEFPAEWADPYMYDDEYDGYDEDEQIEKYYFSSAAGRARVVLGNRRLGENGYMRAGRMYARPVNNSSGQAGGSGSNSNVGGGIGKAGKGRTPGGKGPAWACPSAGAAAAGSGEAEASAAADGTGGGGAGGSGAGPSGAGAAASAGPSQQASKGQGRRAKRNARRAAADFDLDY